MFHRAINLPQKQSYFLFGARGTGKTTLLHLLCPEETTVFVDLLDLEQEAGFIRDPERLARPIDGLSPATRTVVVDEKENTIRYLEAYSRTYLKEEIWNEQIVRKLEPFSYFLEIAAQMNGRVLNFSRIGRNIGVDTKTVQSYFHILEDTLVGFFLPSFHKSVRKRQLTNPKFYFFDTGVKRALERTLTVPLLPQTYGFGEAFEHFVFLEMQRRNEYGKHDFRFSYLQTHDGAKVDFILERPGKPLALVEVKSTTRLEPSMARHLERFCGDFEACEAYLLSLDMTPQKFGHVHALPWEEGLHRLGL